MSDYYSESVADLPLFSLPAQRHSKTSRAAAASLDGDALNAMQRRVLKYLETHGPSTDEEMARGLDMNPSTQRPRRIELQKRGLVVEAGTRKTVSGRKAVVWKATSA
jgi:transcription initiation factor IIE alpha subunit